MAGRIRTTDPEFLKYALLLENCYSVFYKLWGMGVIEFVDHIPTAQIVFDKLGKELVFQFNSKWWDALTEDGRVWIIAHEMWHIINGHGLRIQAMEDKERANIALDIAVHYALENSLGMDRSMLPNWEKFAFQETMFPDRDDVKPGMTAEYYYNLLPPSNENSGGGGQLIDRLEQSSLTPEDLKEIFKELGESLTEEEIEKVKELEKREPQPEDSSDPGGKLPGSSSLGSWIFLNIKKVNYKKKWEEIIRKWVLLNIKEDFKELDSWTDLPRRTHHLLTKDLALPATLEKFVVTPVRNKIEVVFFLDSSGSCWHMAERFFKAVRSVPPEKFKVVLCSFDTTVYELDITEAKMRGGGGTRFDIMEHWIQNEITKGTFRKYPETVFVITDGYGTTLTPLKPEKWVWLLTSPGSKSCIPQKSKIFDLKDFE